MTKREKMNKKLNRPDKKSTNSSEDSPSEEEGTPAAVCLTLRRSLLGFPGGGLRSHILLDGGF